MKVSIMLEVDVLDENRLALLIAECNRSKRLSKLTEWCYGENVSLEMTNDNDLRSAVSLDMVVDLLMESHTKMGLSLAQILAFLKLFKSMHNAATIDDVSLVELISRFRSDLLQLVPSIFKAKQCSDIIKYVSASYWQHFRLIYNTFTRSHSVDRKSLSAIVFVLEPPATLVEGMLENEWAVECERKVVEARKEAETEARVAAERLRQEEDENEWKHAEQILLEKFAGQMYTPLEDEDINSTASMIVEAQMNALSAVMTRKLDSRVDETMSKLKQLDDLIPVQERTREVQDIKENKAASRSASRSRGKVK